MDYFRWKRRIDTCGMLLLLLQPVFWLILADGMVQYLKENYIPVEIKYPLSKVPEDQAVFVEFNCNNGLKYDLIANKEGRWKIIDYLEVDEGYHVGKQRDHMFYDSILQDDSIPWQNEKIIMNPHFLERALNIPDVEFKYIKSSRPIGVMMSGTDWYLIDNSPNRERIYYRGDPLVKQDYTLIYMQNKIKQLSSLGSQVMERKRKHYSRKSVF